MQSNGDMKLFEQPSQSMQLGYITLIAAAIAASGTACSGATGSGSPSTAPISAGAPVAGTTQRALPWTGDFVITGDGYDLDRDPADPENRGDDIDWYEGRLTSIAPDNTVSRWTGSTEPSLGECIMELRRGVYLGGDGNTTIPVAPIVAGAAFCIQTNRGHTAYIEIIGEPQSDGIAARYIVWETP